MENSESNLVAVGLTTAARAEWSDYLATRCKSAEVAAGYLREIEQGGPRGVHPQFGASFEIAGRHEISGNPNPCVVSPSDYVWQEVDEWGCATDGTELVLCQSPDGWSLHPPGSTDDDIATGDAPPLLTGPGRPTSDDYARARARLGA